MKKSIFLLICMSIISLFSQKKVESFSIYQVDGYDYKFTISDSCEFEIYKKIEYIDPDEKRRKQIDSANIINHHMSPTTLYVYSSGKVQIKNNKIKCYDPDINRYYTFTIINDSTLVATKHTALFVKGDTLKRDFYRVYD